MLFKSLGGKPSDLPPPIVKEEISAPATPEAVDKAEQPSAPAVSGDSSQP
jgi:hypothetical protein